jgi:hypothetical protein
VPQRAFRQIVAYREIAVPLFCALFRPDRQIFGQNCDAVRKSKRWLGEKQDVRQKISGRRNVVQMA